MTLTDAEYAQVVEVQQLAAACVKFNDDRTGYQILNPEDPDGTPMLSVGSLEPDEVNAVAPLLAHATQIATEIARIACEQAFDETPPGTLETAPAMADAIASCIAESSGDYTLSLPGDGGELMPTTTIEADSAEEAFLDGLAAQLDDFAVHLEVVADALVNP